MPSPPPRPLADRLGLRDPAAARIVDRPAAFRALGAVPDDDGGSAEIPFQLAFVADAAGIGRLAPLVADRYPRGGHLWLAYPKTTGPIRTDIRRDVGWEPLTERGFLAVAQVALDETWSALRFRRREEIRTLTRKSER